MGNFNEDVREAALAYLASITAGGAPLGPPGVAATSLGKAEDALHASGDVGVAVWGVRSDAAGTAFSGANGDYTPFAVDARGVQFTRPLPSSNPFTPQAFVLTAATNQQVAAANVNRAGLMIVNRSGQEVFLRFGVSAATASLFSWVLAAGEKYELPFGITTPIQAFSTLGGAAPGLIVQEFGTT